MTSKQKKMRSLSSQLEEIFYLYIDCFVSSEHIQFVNEKLNWFKATSNYVSFFETGKSIMFDTFGTKFGKILIVQLWTTNRFFFLSNPI